MKYIPNKTLWLSLLLIGVSLASAKDNRTLETKLADLLVQVPAKNAQQLNQQMTELLALEETGLQQLLGRVIPPGTGDDTAVRIAIEGLSRHLSQPDLESERLAWEALLLKAIDQRQDTHVKSFLISQLNYIGGDATIKGLAKYLDHAILYDPAIRAMRDANSPLAGQVFAGHLETTSGRSQIALINAIGQLGIPEHALAVESLAGRNDPLLQRSVLACLAKLGNTHSYSILLKAAQSTGFLPEKTNATSSLLTYAETLSANGNYRTSLKICKTLMKACSSPEQIHFKTQALLTSAGNSTINKSVDQLVDALEYKDKSYRMAAINYAVNHTSPVSPWIKAFKRTKSNEVKSEILYLFGALASEEAAPLVRQSVKDADPQVRQEAIKSLARIRKQDAVKEILDYALHFEAKEDLDTAQAALLQTIRPNHLPLLADTIRIAPDATRLRLMEVVAAKGNPASFPVLFDQVTQGSKLRTTALKLLDQVVSDDHLPQLLTLLDEVDEQERRERRNLQKAIVTSIKSSHNRDKATQALLDFVHEKESIQPYIGILASVGGEKAIASVYEAYTHGDSAVSEAAYHALIQSNDINAANALYEICCENPSESQRSSAFKSYVRILSRSSLPNDQKLLLLRKIENKAPNTESTRVLLQAMGQVKTFLSFVTLSRYLDNPKLQAEAANALVTVVLPSQGLDNGLTGQLVRAKLLKARDLITGPDSQYLKIDIENYLKQMSTEQGYVSMFNGKDLSGWQGFVTNPIKKKALSAEELKKRQEEANQKAHNNWSVQDQCIVFNGKGANLCSVKEYGDFEMIVDWRITEGGDSGIYLRGTPQVQIWDIARTEVGAQVGSGGLYNNKKHPSKPLVVADNPVGQWNTFRIIMRGDKVTVYLNGQCVVKQVTMENYWDRSMPIFASGPIELQAHGTDLAFRDIYIKELNSGNQLTPEEEAEGFVSLFNGQDLTGWTPHNDSYQVEDGCIVVRPKNSGGNLYTVEEYDDFVFRFEFKLTPGANNGLGIRAPLTGDAAYVGYELQILDNTAPVYAHLKPYQYHGSVYGIIPAKRGYLNPVGEWNTEEVWIKGDDIKITLNGTIIVDGNIKEATQNGTLDGKDHPGLKRTKGHIGFLGHGSVLWFRNIRIKTL